MIARSFEWVERAELDDLLDDAESESYWDGWRDGFEVANDRSASMLGLVILLAAFFGGGLVIGFVSCQCLGV